MDVFFFLLALKSVELAATFCLLVNKIKNELDDDSISIVYHTSFTPKHTYLAVINHSKQNISVSEIGTNNIGVLTRKAFGLPFCTLHEQNLEASI